MSKAMKFLILIVTLFSVFFVSGEDNVYANWKDKFTDTNGTTLDSHNSSYSILFGSLEIQNDKLISAPGVSAFAYPVNNDAVELCIDSTNSLDALSVRATEPESPTTTYQFVATANANTATPTVYTYIGGVAINTHSGSPITISGNHEYCISANGSTITAKYDNDTIISFIDTNITSGGYTVVQLHDYTNEGWTNPIVSVDNFVIKPLH